MACSKYTLTNTSSSIINFNYRRCDDSLWEYQVELLPNQTKNIWSIDETYSISPSFLNSVSFVDNGPFPPILPTVTPTPTVTSTNTPTPTVTSTQTPTPTNVLRSIVIINCHSEISQQLACDCQQPATLFVNNTTLANSTLAWADEFGPNTGPPIGYYVENSIVYYLNGDCSIGCITGSTIQTVGICGPTPTPTETTTPTPTPTNTETPTPTPTETPTPTPTTP